MPYLLYNITEDCFAASIYSAYTAISQRAALPCLLCNITEGCSAISICSSYSATSQRAVLPCVLCTSHRVTLLYLLCNITKGCSATSICSASAKQSMKFKTQLVVHNSSFLAAARTLFAAASTLNIKGSLARACSLQR